MLCYNSEKPCKLQQHHRIQLVPPWTFLLSFRSACQSICPARGTQFSLLISFCCSLWFLSGQRKNYSLPIISFSLSLSHNFTPKDLASSIACAVKYRFVMTTAISLWYRLFPVCACCTAEFPILEE